MSRARSFPTVILLGTGKVLVLGGDTNVDSSSPTDLYDPATGTWSTTGATADIRVQQAGVLLSDGRVLVSGGNPDERGRNRRDLRPRRRDLDSDRRHGRVAGLVHDDTPAMTARVLVTGGFTTDGSSAELYDPASGKWTATAPMPHPRAGDGQTATKLANGKILVTGDPLVDRRAVRPCLADVDSRGHADGRDRRPDGDHVGRRPGPPRRWRRRRRGGSDRCRGVRSRDSRVDSHRTDARGAHQWTSRPTRRWSRAGHRRHRPQQQRRQWRPRHGRDLRPSRRQLTLVRGGPGRSSRSSGAAAGSPRSSSRSRRR